MCVIIFWTVHLSKKRLYFFFFLAFIKINWFIQQLTTSSFSPCLSSIFHCVPLDYLLTLSLSLSLSLCVGVCILFYFSHSPFPLSIVISLYNILFKSYRISTGQSQSIAHSNTLSHSRKTSLELYFLLENVHTNKQTHSHKAAVTNVQHIHAHTHLQRKVLNLGRQFIVCVTILQTHARDTLSNARNHKFSTVIFHKEKIKN